MTSETIINGAYRAASLILANGGGTFVSGSYRQADHTYGYYVSVAGYERTVELTGCTTKDHALIRAELANYDDALFGYGRAGWGKFIGTWVYEGKLYFDISEHVKTAADAWTLARDRAQLAYWDIAENRTIEL